MAVRMHYVVTIALPLVLALLFAGWQRQETGNFDGVMFEDLDAEALQLLQKDAMMKKKSANEMKVQMQSTMDADASTDDSGPVYTPMYTATTMPPVSTTLKCVMMLSFLYFGLYTALAIVRTLVSFKFGLHGLLSILESGCTTATLAPMLCVLFLGAQLRANTLMLGGTNPNLLPQPWVQTSMLWATFSLVGQAIMVLFVGFASGMGSITKDKDGNYDTSSMPGGNILAMVLTAGTYVLMFMLYGGFTAVICGIFTMKGPNQIPVSPAVKCTIINACIFFLIYLIVQVTQTLFELAPTFRSWNVLMKLQASSNQAKMTVNFAPMICILFIATRLRALQMGLPGPQHWAQDCMFLCTYSVMIMAVLVMILPFAAAGECKRGAVEGEVDFVMESPMIGSVLTVLRYLCLFALYGGTISVVVSVLTIQAPGGPSMTPPISPAMKCVIFLTALYFIIYTGLFVCITIKNFAFTGDDDSNPLSKAMTMGITIFDTGRACVMFAPMLCNMFVGTRMRALRIAVDTQGAIPPTAGPQRWVQECEFMCVWAVFIQLIMTILVPMLTGTDKVETDEDGNVKMPAGANKYLAIVVEIVRYACLIMMYGGASAVVDGVYSMTPETIQPYGLVTSS